MVDPGAPGGLRHLTDAGVSVWLDPGCLAGHGRRFGQHVTGVGPALPAGRAPARIGVTELPAPPEAWDEPEALVALEGPASAPDVVVGLPFTVAGLQAAEELIFRGTSISVWPVCSPREFRRAADAYRLGLERRLAAGRSPAGLRAIAWIPVGAIDGHADAVIGRRCPELVGDVGPALAALLYLESFRLPADPQWIRVREAGAARPCPAFCELDTVPALDALERLALPGAIVSLSPEHLAAAVSGPRPVPAEPDETEAAWVVARACRSGLRLPAMSQALRLRLEVRARRAWVRPALAGPAVAQATSR
jgi:hypothetical protein